MKNFYNPVLAISTIEIDTSVIIVIILAMISAASYIAVLEYRFRKLENHPFLKGLRKIHEDQMVDLARGLIKRGEKDVE